MSVDALKGKLGTGARPNKYKIFINRVGDGETIDALAKAASLPDATIGVIELFSQGRKLPIAGDATYAGTWDVTFYNTADLGLKQLFEDWMNEIDSFKDNTRAVDNINDYIDTLQVQQLKGDNSIAATYVIHNAWPSAISAVDLADDANDTVSEFTVTFSYSHWERA